MKAYAVVILQKENPEDPYSVTCTAEIQMEPFPGSMVDALHHIPNILSQVGWETYSVQVYAGGNHIFFCLKKSDVIQLARS